jgi:hypothetical protein
MTEYLIKDWKNRDNGFETCPSYTMYPLWLIGNIISKSSCMGSRTVSSGSGNTFADRCLGNK